MDPLFQIQITCLCCGFEFSTSRVRPSLKRATRTDTDFCSYFGVANPDFYVVRVCPSCGYASTENSSDRLTDKQKQAYLDQIGKMWSARDYGGERTLEEALACYKLALLSAQAVEENDRLIASLLHHIAWLYRYQGNEGMELKFLQFALDSYIQAYQTERDADKNARLLYLIGELHRRTGNYHEAVRWFTRVIHDKSITDAAMIRASREQWTQIREDLTAAGAELPEEMTNGA
ncbi:DUF2225 domain-containing protein [Cohnella lubricantis]|uniref:DUF2225 domain-containing protein n=1 Tax=Cohnella lubricantis TaxID=2163172 RepID=A0A841TE42_9BACL|nr:DUF2225 domain-containing protein [Cohnella lubricantis]MBB6678259.1 DUF2225 domain-containing protein [Cohnella lubricantis]MBP2118460.1 uncharacterized protein (DUF2225 family) [Cohnella lubricantis]